MNLYKKHFKAYLEKGYVPVPDKYAKKGFALKGLSFGDYENMSPTELEELSEDQYLEDKGSNIAVTLGEKSGIIALDLDTDNQEILNKIAHLLPDSPVEKKGSKGWTRFFKYSGESTEVLKYNGDVVLEVLSNNKKTTLPPSKHQNGSNYVWMSEKTLLDINKNELPVFPPFLIAHLSVLLGNGNAPKEHGKVVGRNNNLQKHLGVLLEKEHTADSILKDLITFDREQNNPPYFTDPNEFSCMDETTNALNFYSSMLSSINSKRHRENKEYLKPVMQSVLDIEKIKEMAGKKLTAKGDLKRLNILECTHANSVIKKMVQNILDNSWVRQPDLALGTVLSLLSVTCARKFQFRGMSSNLYVANISKSGTGKNAGIQFVKKTLINSGQTRLLGSADIPSEAGLMDSLENKYTQILPLDEIGGIIKTVVSGSSEYNSKLGDLLCELYTCSTDRFLGRSLATVPGQGSNTRGAVDRPNLTILGATTPRGFEEAISRSAIQKGLLGRFLLFFGDSSTPSTMVKEEKKLPKEVEKQLEYLYQYQPDKNGMIETRPQFVDELEITEEADKRLVEIFKEFDTLRLENLDDTHGPIAARLFQQMTKIIIISACSGSKGKLPVVNLSDVEFAREVILYCFENFKLSISGMLFDNYLEKQKHDILSKIIEAKAITRPQLMRDTAYLEGRKRESILMELIESKQIAVEGIVNSEGITERVYYAI